MNYMCATAGRRYVRLSIISRPSQKKPMISRSFQCMCIYESIMSLLRALLSQQFLAP